MDKTAARKLPTDTDGKLSAYAWPGGYPIYYLTQDDGVLCPKCANDNRHLSGDEYDPQWNVVAADVNWEDNYLVCDNCYNTVESAYGEEEE